MYDQVQSENNNGDAKNSVFFRFVHGLLYFLEGGVTSMLNKEVLLYEPVRSNSRLAKGTGSRSGAGAGCTNLR